MESAAPAHSPAALEALSAALRRCGMADGYPAQGQVGRFGVSKHIAEAFVREVDAAAANPALQRMLFWFLVKHVREMPPKMLPWLAGAGFADSVLRATAAHSDDAKLVHDALFALVPILGVEELAAGVFAPVAREALRVLSAHLPAAASNENVPRSCVD
jgi:hypothetical protein